MLNIPEKNIHDSGAFELAYDKKQVEKCDDYNLSPYVMYGYGDMQVMDIENLLITLDVRHFTGSVRTYIAVHKPDVVIVMYTGSLSGSIDWSSHKDKFDFR